MLEIAGNFYEYLLVGEYPKGPLGGLAMTIVVAVFCLASTFPLAVGLALIRVFGHPVLRRIATVYVYAVRGIPLLLLILFVYFLIPVLIKIPLSGFVTLSLAIVLYQTAYLSEVIRGGIEALPRGQIEAARALGLPTWLIIRKVVLPQALFNVIPGIVNQFTLVIKETSLGYVIAFNELTHAAAQINAILMTKPLQVYAILALVYFVLCFILSRVVKLLENRIVRSRRYNAMAEA